MSLDPVPVLLGIIVHSNIGGSLTPIGDPISIIICSNHFFMKNVSRKMWLKAIVKSGMSFNKETGRK